MPLLPNTIKPLATKEKGVVCRYSLFIANCQSMKRYPHYSFDLWLTLIKSNPLFKSEREKYLFEKHNPCGIELANVKKIIRQVDLMCNMSNEWTGQCIEPLQMYAMVLQQMGHTSVKKDALRNIYADTEQIFFANLPTLYSDDTYPVLETLYNEGSQLHLISNTGYMSGKTMTEVLKRLGMMWLFKTTIFSDEICFSKPNYLAFRQLDNRITGSFTDAKSNVLHVGDNPFADGQGASAFGYDTFIVHSTNNTLLELIQ